MDYSKLCGKITEVFKNNYEFAKALGVDNSTLSAKLNNKTDFKREEIEKSCELLGIPIEQVHLYFFKRKVEISQL